MTPLEPTTADVLAAFNGLTADVGQLRTEMSVRFDRADAKVEQVRAADAQEAIRRHLADPHAHGRDAA
jgi:hypothetical protein